MDDGAMHVRHEMVEAAKKFMMTPKVSETPFSEQREFLLAKGVTDAEIEEARKLLPPTSHAPAHNAIATSHAPAPQNRVLSFAQSALVVGSVSYAGYRFLRSYVLPRFFDIPDPATQEVRQLQQQLNDLQNSMKFVIDSVSQTTQTLSIQQEEISKALLTLSSRESEMGRLEHGISTIKGLLLSHNQFAPIQAPLAVNTLPAWQRNPQSTSPPANFASSTPSSSDSVPVQNCTPPASNGDQEKKLNGGAVADDDNEEGEDKFEDTLVA